MRSSWQRTSKLTIAKIESNIIVFIIIFIMKTELLARYETQLIKTKTEICLLEQAIGTKRRKLEEVIIIIAMILMMMMIFIITVIMIIIFRRRGKRKNNFQVADFF